MKTFQIFILLSCIYFLSHAQPGTLDLSFDPGTGFNDVILTSTIQADGRIIIGGQFTDYNGFPTRFLARLNPNGSVDSSFVSGTGIDNVVITSAVQADQKIILGGVFTAYNGTIANGIVRINPDGSIDSGFNTGSGFNDRVKCIAIQDDGKILVGGDFNSFDGNTSNNLVRLNTDGSFDNSFNIGTTLNSSVEDIDIYPGTGQILIGGDFSVIHSMTSANIRLLRLNPDGSMDSTFTTGWGPSRVVFDVDILKDGTIAIVGNFSSYNSASVNRYARLNPSGTLNGSHVYGLGFNREVKKILTVDRNHDGINDAYFFGGLFTDYQSQTANHIALIDTFGLSIPDFNPGTGPDNSVLDVSLQNDNRVIIVGGFNEYNGIPRNGIARIYICQTAQPDSIIGSATTRCPGETLTYSVPLNPVVDYYEWTLPPGWTGSSDSASITVISNGQGGVLSVKAFTDSCGYSIPMQKNIERVQPPYTPICLVTVDSSSNHNIVIWGKPMDKSFIDSFLIYRETTTGVYTKIAGKHRDSLSEYHDYDANPNATSYRYKISVLDTCGVESDLSPYHNSIHLQNLGNGNLQWTFYQIESSTNPVTEFNVYRDNFGNGNFTQIGLVPGTNSTFTDISYSSFPDAEYLVDVHWGISCSPVARTVNTTRSNIRKGSAVTIIDTSIIDTVNNPIDTLDNDTTQNNDTSTVLVNFDALDLYVNIYPNPATDVVYINTDAHVQVKAIQVFDLPGKEVLRKLLPSNSNLHSIPLDNLKTGIYLVLIDTNRGQVRKKLFVR
ncbi:MAG: T9SS type A sorting domain-containing protein [Chitinophagales bacterium]